MSFPYDPGPGPRRHAPATRRNRDPILAVLRRVLPTTGTVLEVGSGTGEHVAFFAAALPGLRFQPTDREPEALESIAAHAVGRVNVAPPRALDVLGVWPPGPYEAVFCANVVHIAPPTVWPALVRGAAEVLAPGGRFVLYGPFTFDGQHVSDSNVAFDGWLKARDPSFGVRDAGAIVTEAAGRGLRHDETVPMPANNHILVFTRG